MLDYLCVCVKVQVYLIKSNGAELLGRALPYSFVHWGFL